MYNIWKPTIKLFLLFLRQLICQSVAAVLADRMYENMQSRAEIRQLQSGE